MIQLIQGIIEEVGETVSGCIIGLLTIIGLVRVTVDNESKLEKGELCNGKKKQEG